MIYEYCKGGEFFKKQFKYAILDENIAAQYFQQMMQALNYYHSKAICHRNLKPENILLMNNEDKFTIKIANFCTSSYKDFKARALEQPQYRAPEVFRGVCDEKSDLWTIGVILYLMLVGNFPFLGKNPSEIAKAIIKFKMDVSSTEY